MLITPDLGYDVERVLSTIRCTGGRPMLVGGFVRDAILHPGSVSKDIDVEVYGVTDVDHLAGALADVADVSEVGKSFGVLKVTVGDRETGRTDLDISLPRREAKTGAGHRGFDVIPDGTLGFREASGRRDFTMNAIMADPQTGEIIDCWGGLADLRAGVLRHTTAAFSEDPLRVLRAAQFAARFGFTLAPETAALCRQLAGAYTELPIERVWCEMEKIGTRGVNITAALRVLAETGWEQHFPQIAALHGIPQDPAWHPEGDVHTHSGLAADQAARAADTAGLTGTDRFVVVMAALLHDLGKVTHTFVMPGAGGGLKIMSQGHADAGVNPARGFLECVGCPESLIVRIVPLIREHMNCMGGPRRPAVRRLARRLVPATMRELALVIGADRAGRGDPDAPNPAARWLELATEFSIEERPAKGLLTGDHLIAAGMKPGPAFKPVLAAALAAQDAGKFEDEAGALAWLAGQGRPS